MAASATLHPTSPVPPARSRNQRQEALALANETRLYRASYKRQIRMGQLSLIDELEGPVYENPRLKTMAVADLLPAVPRLGPSKVRRILIEAGISYCKTIGGLTPRQRNELLAETIQQIPHTRVTR